METQSERDVLFASRIKPMVGILSLQNADCDKDQTEIPQALFNSLTMTATAQCDPGPGGGGSLLSDSRTHCDAGLQTLNHDL